VVLIGAMKCGTSALHASLDHHPDIAMSRPKELNFFFGPVEDGDRGQAPGSAGGDGRSWATGNWSRGVAWYASHFLPGAPVRGESSPGYTSPDHPHVASRMAAMIPDARLIYLVRDPVARALSQYRHHRAEGMERRDTASALLDPDSQYITRGLYYERLLPFTAHYPRGQILIVAQEDLRDRPAPTLRRVFEYLRVDDASWCDAFECWSDSTAHTTPPLAPGVRNRLAVAFRGDVHRLRTFANQQFAAWSV
jgi:hypothetical protein